MVANIPRYVRLASWQERPHLEPDPATAPVVSRMYKEALGGVGTKEICLSLNQEGVAGPRGKPWQKTTVHHILTNEAYTGTLVWERSSRVGNTPSPVRVEKAWHPLVDEETFNGVQQALHARAFPQAHPRRTATGLRA